MTTRAKLLAAYADGALLETVSRLAVFEHESVVDLLANLHNSGDVDFLATCRSEELDRLPQRSYFGLQHVFCDSLPNIECPVTAAAVACDRMFEKAGSDGTASLVFRALREWFQHSPSRVAEGLSLICRNTDNHPRLVRPVLIAGATHDAKRYTEEALALSRATQSSIRMDALFALGQIAPEGDSSLLHRVIERFTECISAPDSDHCAAIALEAALNLLKRTGDIVATDVHDLLVKASSNPTPAVLRVLADGLSTRQNKFTDSMTNASLKALRHTDKQDADTIREVDLFLYQSDLDADRNRILKFLTDLLTHGDNPIEIDQFRNFRHNLKKASGKLLGWYVVSLLLTGDPRLCMAAFDLLPYQEQRDGLDIDLRPFALGPSWIPYLARKILGFCLLRREGAAALLLSCLRSVSETDRAELEELIMDHFLMNYLTAIEWFESTVASDDQAKKSVDKLSASLKIYLKDLTECGICSAFAPSERERQLQKNRHEDFWREAHKKAQEHSILSTVAHTATVLYGSGSIAYVYDKDNNGPHRKEIPFVTHEHSAEFPRLYALDPVGLNYASNLFRSEAPPE